MELVAPNFVVEAARQSFITIAAKKYQEVEAFCANGKDTNQINLLGYVASLSATTTQKCRSVLQIATKERARRNGPTHRSTFNGVAHWAMRLLNSGRARESELLDDRIGGHLFPRSPKWCRSTHDSRPSVFSAFPSSQRATADNGARLAGFNTIVQPAASAAPAFRVPS